jgi:hypothetical protein
MMVSLEIVRLAMLEILQAVHILAGVFLLAVLTILLVFGFRGLCLPKTSRPSARRVGLDYVPLPPQHSAAEREVVT